MTLTKTNFELAKLYQAYARNDASYARLFAQFGAVERNIYDAIADQDEAAKNSRRARECMGLE